MSKSRNGENPRSVALVGPQGSGKSALFDALDGGGRRHRQTSRRPAQPPRDDVDPCGALRLPWMRHGRFWIVPGRSNSPMRCMPRWRWSISPIVVCEPDPGARECRRASVARAGERAGAAHRADQQNRYVRRLGRRRDRRAAGLRRVAAGAAADADHRKRPYRRLCRSHERARVSLSQGPGLRN